MQFLPPQILELKEALRALPGVGERTAERYVFYLLRQDRLLTEKLLTALTGIREGFDHCPTCQNYTTTNPCPLCSDPRRDPSTIAVVAEPLDIVLLEQTGGYHGSYHVLHGRIEPLRGIGVQDLKIPQLLQRVQTGEVKEVILALDSDLPGEATSAYLAKELSSTSARITRLAQGIPQGGEIGYLDPETLTRALRERRDF